MNKKSVICAIAKNEGDYIVEWLKHHKSLGFSRVYLYDNDSTDGMVQNITANGLSDFVQVIHWPSRPGQLSAYANFISNYAQYHEWCAFIDVDEFFVLESDLNINEFVSDAKFSGYSAVLVNWLVFGPSGHSTSPSGELRTNFKYRLPESFEINFHVKSLVRCSAVEGTSGNPHIFEVNGKVCNVVGSHVDNVAIQKSGYHKELFINHYFTKSKEEWVSKVQRGFATSEDPNHRYSMHMFEHIEHHACIEDNRVLRFCI